MRMQRVRDPATLLVGNHQRGEGDEIEQIPPSPPDHERGGEQHEQVVVGRDREAPLRDRERKGAEESGKRPERRAAIEVWARWAPALAALGAAVPAVLLRLPFWHAPLTADEGGFAEVARLWDRGAVLYRDIWVDRPQGLLLVFRGVVHLGGGSTEVIRAVAAAVGVLVVLATMLLALRLAGRITAVLAGLLAATVGASPFVESFTLSGELVASFWVVVSLLAFAGYIRTRRLVWAFAAGLLAGAALMTKQSAIDAGLAAAAYLVWRERRRALRPLGALVLGMAVPVAAAAASAPRLGDWWFAVVGYRGHGDSLLTGSFQARLDMLADSIPNAAKALGLLVLLAAVAWRRAPLLARLWLGAAVLGFLGGGNFHPHYYLQLVPPLALLAGIGAARLLAARPRAASVVLAAAATASVALAAPLWFAGAREQAKEIWPHDPHLVHDAAVADYVRSHTHPGERIFVVWAAADLYYLADRDPAFKYMWFRNVQTIPHALRDARRMLAARRPTLVVAAQPPGSLDRSGRTAEILRREYRLAARVDGVPIYRIRRAGYIRR